MFDAATNCEKLSGRISRRIQVHGRLLVHQHIDRVERSALREKHLVQSLPEILEYMKAVRDLCG